MAMGYTPSQPLSTQLPSFRYGFSQSEANPGGTPNLPRSSYPNTWTMNTSNPAFSGGLSNLNGPAMAFGRKDFSHSFDPAIHVRQLQIPLPITSDADLTDPRTIAHATGHSPAPKAAGARRKKQPASILTESILPKAKCKRKREDLDSGLDSQNNSDVEQAARTTGHGGRRPGAGNYKDIDLDELLNLTERELPLSQKGWQKISSRFKIWAKVNKRPVRDAKSLESKFKQLVKTTKPTGDGKRPPSVTRAKAIDRLINDRAGTQFVDDSELDNNNGDDDNHSESPSQYLPSQSVKVERAVIRASDKSDIQPRRTRATHSADLMQKLASALDPDIQNTRDDERASRSFQNTQIFTLSQQLRDSQATNDKLRGEVDSVRHKVYKLERSLDRARMKLELHYGPRPKRLPTGRKNLPDIVRTRGKIQSVEHFPEGGSYTTWVTDGSTATDWSDSDKENFDYHKMMNLMYEPHYGLRSPRSPRQSLSSSSPLRTITLPPSASLVPDSGPGPSSSSPTQVSPQRVRCMSIEI